MPMSELGYWTKTSRLDEGFLGTALAAAIDKKKQKKLVFVGILTVTNDYSSGLASDAVGQKIQTAIDQMKRFQVIVKVRKIVSPNLNEVMDTLKNWSDNLGLDVVLTIGGTGIDTSSVTPDATKRIINKEMPAMTLAMVMSGLKVDPLAMLFRGVCGVRNSALIINLPDNAQRAGDCLGIVLPHLPYAIDCLKEGRSVEDRPENISNSSDPPSRTTIAASLRNTSSPAHHIVATAHHMLPDHRIASPQPAAHVAPTHYAAPTHHVTRSHLQESMSPSRADSGIASFHHLPSHHHSERLQNDVIITNERSPSTEAFGQLTEDEILGGDSFEGLIAKESLRVVGDLPAQFDVEPDGGGLVSNSKNQDFSKIARRPRTSPFPEVTVDKALATVFAVTNSFPVVEKQYKDTLDHVLASDVIARKPVPAVNTALLDGYAVIAADTPGDLDVVELAKNELLTLGKAVRVTTGAPMPPGADAVVAVEETLLVSEADNGRKEVSVRCLSRASPGQFVLAKGSDIQCDEMVIKAGTTIGHLEVALLASLGISTIRVHKFPVVAVISYGAKLREPDENTILADEVRDTNRLTLLIALKKKSYPVVDMGIVNGGAKALQETLIRAYEKADVIITTGGAAIGENDVVKPVLVQMGAFLHFGRVIMKPGAPTGFATLDTPRGKKIFFTLAGVPVPAYIGYSLFVLPCLRRLHGCKDPRSALIKVRLSADIRLDIVPEYQRVSIRSDGESPIPWADVTGRQVISRMLSLVAADALLLLPAKTDQRLTIKRGEILEAMLMA